MNSIVLKFLYHVVNVLWIAGSICLACFILYYTILWNWNSVHQSMFILMRISIITIISYIIQLKLKPMIAKHKTEVKNEVK